MLYHTESYMSQTQSNTQNDGIIDGEEEEERKIMAIQ